MPTTNNECPCDAVVDLRDRVDRLEEKLHTDYATILVMQRDVEFIKEKISEKTKFNGNILNTLINGAITIVLGYIAIKLGMG